MDGKEVVCDGISDPNYSVAPVAGSCSEVAVQSQLGLCAQRNTRVDPDHRLDSVVAWQNLVIGIGLWS